MASKFDSENPAHSWKGRGSRVTVSFQEKPKHQRKIFLLKPCLKEQLTCELRLVWVGFFYRTNSCLCLIQMLQNMTASSMNQVDNGVPNVPCQAVLSDTDVPLGQVDVEDGLFQDGSFPCFLLAKDRNAAGPEHGVIKPHQLHLGEICTERELLSQGSCTQATAPQSPAQPG